jgi:ribonuclease E
LQQIESRYGCHVTVDEDETLVPPAFRLDRVRAFTPAELAALPVPHAAPVPVEEEPDEDEAIDEATIEATEEEFAESTSRTASEGDRAEPSSWLPLSQDDEDEEAEPVEGDAEGRNHGEGQPHGDGQGRRRRRRRRRGRGGDRGHDRGGAPMAGSEAVPSSFEPELSPGVAASDEGTSIEAVGEGQPSEELQPTEINEAGLESDSERRRRRRGRRGGRRRHRGPGPDVREPEPLADGDRGPPRLQLELRPGEPGYSGPAEEFGEELDLGVEAESEGADAIVEPALPPNEEKTAREPHPATAETTRQRQEAPPAPLPLPTQSEPERAPVAYNVPPPQEVSGPAPNPRRGWWRR